MINKMMTDIIAAKSTFIGNTSLFLICEYIIIYERTAVNLNLLMAVSTKCNVCDNLRADNNRQTSVCVIK